MNEKKQTSNLSIGGFRLGKMRQFCQEIFEDSFLSIEVSAERIFLIRLENTVDLKKLDNFKAKYKLCKIIVYQCIDFSDLKKVIKRR